MIVLSGKPDLTLGQPDGTVAGKVIIDFKTGGFSPSHREDLRFYALLEALRILPPRLLATYYLDQGRVHSEEVTHDLLLSAAEQGGRRRPSLRRADLRSAPGDRGSRPGVPMVPGPARLRGGNRVLGGRFGTRPPRMVNRGQA